MSGRKAREPKRRIVVIIEGERYDNLERVAQAMNGVSWCDTDNTPETVFENFVFPWSEDFLDSPARLAESILDGIATSEDGRTAPEPLHTERLKELKAAFSVFNELRQ